MELITDHLNNIHSLLTKLSHGDSEFFDELHQRTALNLSQRLRQGMPIHRGIAIGIARHIAADIVEERQRLRNRFVSFSGLEDAPSNEGQTSAPNRIQPITPDHVFGDVWEELCCRPLRLKVAQWRKSLSPQVRRSLRGLRRGMTQAEVAAQENVRPGTVASWSSREYRKLRIILKAA
jgi:DNA-directed RNA polymerase specialized sigma24 family protein